MCQHGWVPTSPFWSRFSDTARSGIHLSGLRLHAPAAQTAERSPDFASHGGGLGIALLHRLASSFGVAMRLTEQPPTPVAKPFIPLRTPTIAPAPPAGRTAPQQASAPMQTLAAAPPPSTINTAGTGQTAPAPMPPSASPLTSAHTPPTQSMPVSNLPAPGRQFTTTPTQQAAQPPAIPVMQIPGVTDTAQAAPSQPDRPFNSIPVTGGAPRYPASLATDGRPGTVTVDARIGIDGKPSHCRIAQSSGAAFATVTSEWLKSGTVRFAPIVHNGGPATETHRWSVRIEESADARASARAAATPTPTTTPSPTPAVVQAPAPVSARPAPPAAVAPKPVAVAASPAPGDRPFTAPAGALGAGISGTICRSEFGRARQRKLHDRHERPAERLQGTCRSWVGARSPPAWRNGCTGARSALPRSYTPASRLPRSIAGTSKSIRDSASLRACSAEFQERAIVANRLGLTYRRRKEVFLF